MRRGPHHQQHHQSPPPLHHPHPKHPIPVLKSPPPPQHKMAAHPIDNGNFVPAYMTGVQQHQQQQHGAAAGYPSHEQPFGNNNNNNNNFFNPQTAQMGYHMGRSAMMAGQEYVEANLNRYVPLSTVRNLFQVNNAYVGKKLMVLLVPWRHGSWSRHLSVGENGGFKLPRDDVNSPDLYIPVMGVVTYILIKSVFAGIQGNFHPEMLGYLASFTFASLIAEIMILKFACYLLAPPSSNHQFIDLVAYAGYKYVAIITTLMCSWVFSSWWVVKYGLFTYLYLAHSFFLLRSLRYLVLPEHRTSIQFLFVYSFIIQLLPMWLML